MNIERITAVRSYILANPDKYDQQFLVGMAVTPDAPLQCDFVVNYRHQTACRSTECVAGSACLIFQPELFQRIEGTDYFILNEGVNSQNLWKMGTELLDLTQEEADRLFTEIDEDMINGDDSVSEDKYRSRYRVYSAEDEVGIRAWPYEYALAYSRAESPEERATIAAARIDRFIATEGRE